MQFRVICFYHLKLDLVLRACVTPFYQFMTPINPHPQTSLLMTILGELSIQAGSVRAHGKIAYVSQHPWIFSGSLRQNILFGEDYNQARYDKIIRISALSRVTATSIMYRTTSALIFANIKNNNRGKSVNLIFPFR